MSPASSGVSVRRTSPLASTTCALRAPRSLRALLDEQHGESPLADRRERVEDDVGDRRREAERRLVEEEHVGSRDERAGDRELLLLAAGAPRLPRTELGDDREHPEHALEVLVRADLRAPPGQPEAEVLLDRQLGVDPAALRHERDAGSRDGLGRPAAKRPLAEPDVPPPTAGRDP